MAGVRELEIDVARLRDLIASGAALELLDVREPWEYELCHIAASRAIPLGELQQRSDELGDARSSDDRPLVVICHHGMRSMNATLWLRQQGYQNAVNLAGGIDAWARLVDPAMTRY
jgi:rhodanese-related sulfurtransferase